MLKSAKDYKNWSDQERIYAKKMKNATQFEKIKKHIYG